MSLEQRAKLMQLVAAILGVYALLWSLAPYESINWPARFILNMSAGSWSELSASLAVQAQWLSAIGAGLLMAVAIVAYGIVAPAIRQGDVNALRYFKLAILAWYVLDSLGSLAAGVAINIVFNTMYLALIFLPLMNFKFRVVKSA